MPDEIIENTGVILGRRSADFVAGEEVGALPYEERNPSGDWRPYLPVGERQNSRPGTKDSMSCVTFSAENSIEIQEKQQTGHESNYSDRWSAKVSETMPTGNYLWKVADTIRKMGLVPESMYPAPPTPWDFAKYHENIAEPLASQLKAEGLKWLEKWEISYEWIPLTKASLQYHLKHAPIQVVFPNHAVCGILCEADIVKYFDSYPHTSGGDYTVNKPFSQFTDALKIVLTKKKLMLTTKKVKVISGGNTSFGVAVITPNMVNITLAEDEAEWRSYGKADSYGVTTVNANGTTNWDVDETINL